MPQKPLPTITPRADFVCDTAGSILSIRIRGEIDHHTASAIRQGIDKLLFEKRPATLILDLSAVGFMDSSGLGLIMGRYSVMKELGGELTVRDPSRETAAILNLAGMERLVRIEYPRGEAFSSSPAGQASPCRSPGGAEPQKSPRRRKKNGLVYEIEPRKEKKA
jgi:stage II sporulation protein AA (anti-sigma F factor antagonist)